MKKLKKLMAVLMMGFVMVSMVGCGSGADKTETSEEVSATTEETETAETATEAVDTETYQSNIALASEVTEVGTLKMNAPEGWEAEVQDSPVGAVAQFKGEGSNSVVVMMVEGSEYQGIDMETYVKEVETMFGQKAGETGLAMNLVGTEVVKLPVADAGIFIIEMPFQAEMIQGWLAEGNLTQEQIDEAGGEEAFIANTKIVQVQTHILTDKGLVTVIGNSTEGVDFIKEQTLGVASTLAFNE